MVTKTPVFSQGVKSAGAVCTAAKTTYNDIANAQLCVTAGANGGVLYGAKATAAGTVALTQCALFTHDGATTRPIAYGVLTAYAMAPTTAPPSLDFGWAETAPRRLSPGEKIYAGTAVANAGGVAFDLQYEDL